MVVGVYERFLDKQLTHPNKYMVLFFRWWTTTNSRTGTDVLTYFAAYHVMDFTPVRTTAFVKIYIYIYIIYSSIFKCERSFTDIYEYIDCYVGSRRGDVILRYRY